MNTLVRFVVLLLLLVAVASPGCANNKPQSALQPAPSATKGETVPGRLTIVLPDGTEAVITPKAEALAKYFDNDPSYFVRKIKGLVEGELLTDLGEIGIGVRREVFVGLKELAAIEYRGKPDRPDPRPQIRQIDRANASVYGLVGRHFLRASARASIEKVLGTGKWGRRDFISGSFTVQYAISPQETVDASYSANGLLLDLYLTPRAEDKPYEPGWEARVSRSIDSYLRIRRGVAAFLMKVEPGLTADKAEARMDRAIQNDGKVDLAMLQRLVAARTTNGPPATRPGDHPVSPATQP
jgi:hypothetical protein